MIRSKLVLLVAAVVVAVLAGVVLLREEAPARASGHGAAVAGPQARAARYALELDAEVLVEGERSRVVLAGQLERTERDATTAHVRFEGDARLELGERTLVATGDSPVRAALARGATVRHAGGVVLACRHDAAPGSMADRLLRTIVASTQFAASATATVEEGPEGVFDCRYVATFGRVTKTRALRPANHLLRSETAGATVATFGGGSLRALSGDETLTVTQVSPAGSRQVVSVTRTRVRLALAGSAPAAAIPALRGPEAGLHRSQPRDPGATDRALVRGRPLPQLLAATATVDDVKAADRLVAALAAHVRLDPGAARAIVSALRATAPGDRREALLLVALGAAGTDASEEALVAVAVERRREPLTLVQAIPALVMGERPSLRVEQLLRELHRDPLLPGEVTGSALLALGTVASRTGDARAAGLVAEIARESAADPAVLLALGNAGGERVLPLVETWLAADRPAPVRARAVHALRNVPGPRAEALLVALLADPELLVRRASAALLAVRPLSPAALAALAVTLPAQTDERVRQDVELCLGGGA